jgi:hypothetical protein
LKVAPNAKSAACSGAFCVERAENLCDHIFG